MKQLIIAGLGIKDLQQMTIETLTHIHAADEVLYLGCEPQKHLPELKKWGVGSIQSLIELYVDGDIDDHNYARIQQVVEQAARKNAKTVLLVPGHPRIGVTLVQRLVATDLDVQVLPGLSSFDTMINDLGRDPLEKGSLMIDANRMLLFDLQWPSSLDCYLYHVCSVGTRHVHVRDAQKDNSWDLLKQHLLKIYNPQTTVNLISSATSEKKSFQKYSTTLENLESLKVHVHFGTTLFVQAEKPKRLDRQFLQCLQEGSSHVTTG